MSRVRTARAFLGTRACCLLPTATRQLHAKALLARFFPHCPVRSPSLIASFLPPSHTQVKELEAKAASKGGNVLHLAPGDSFEVWARRKRTHVSHKRTHPHTQTPAHAQALTHAYIHSYTHTHTIITHTHTHTHTHNLHTHARTHTHTHTHTRTHTHTYVRTHTHTLSHSLTHITLPVPLPLPVFFSLVALRVSVRSWKRVSIRVESLTKL